MKLSRSLAAVCLAALAACGGGSPAPAGWQPKGTDTWEAPGGGQTFSYAKAAYTGTLQDLVTSHAVDVALRGPKGAKFVSSTPYADCPGVAAIEVFALPHGQTLEEGLSVTGGQAVTVQYRHPAGVHANTDVQAAMHRALCVAAY